MIIIIQTNPGGENRDELTVPLLLLLMFLFFWFENGDEIIEITQYDMPQKADTKNHNR